MRDASFPFFAFLLPRSSRRSRRRARRSAAMSEEAQLAPLAPVPASESNAGESTAGESGIGGFDASASSHEPAETSAAPALLSSYRAHDSLFSSSHTQLHARGVLQPLTRASDDDLAGASERLLAQVAAEAGRLPLLGAVPFEGGQPARLWVPAQAVRGRARATAAPSTARPAMRTESSRTSSRCLRRRSSSATSSARCNASTTAGCVKW
nr:hypothetical protein [Lysobacter enzymogenes]